MRLVFSDLDGTLLDHDSYSFEPARPALALLANLDIPLILASSKTEAEMRPIAGAMGLDHPLIVENGAGIVWPQGGDEPAGTGTGNDYAVLRGAIDALPPAIRSCFRGFGDWTVETVAHKTGLGLVAAARAKDRRFSEPGLFSGDAEQKDEFGRLLAERGYQAVQGGRFLTVMAKTSKAERMTQIVELYRRMAREPVETIALGDAPNDLAMLQSADIGVIIANPAHGALPVTQREQSGYILRSTLSGPAGWNEMIIKLVGAER